MDRRAFLAAIAAAIAAPTTAREIEWGTDIINWGGPALAIDKDLSIPVDFKDVGTGVVLQQFRNFLRVIYVRNGSVSKVDCIPAEPGKWHYIAFNRDVPPPPVRGESWLKPVLSRLRILGLDPGGSVD